MSNFKFPLTIQEVPDEENKFIMNSKLMNPIYVGSTKFRIPSLYKGLAESLYNFQFRPDDILVMAFPKSGTIWMSEIIWAMTHLQELDMATKLHVNDRVYFLDGDILVVLKKEIALKRFEKECPNARVEDGIIMQLAKADTKARVLVTHMPPSFFNPENLKRCKVVYVARNPKDICVSYHQFLINIQEAEPANPFEDFTDHFMKDDLLYTPYPDHIKQAWATQKDQKNFHFVFYENLKKDFLKELKVLNTFLGLNLSDDQLLRVTAHTSLARMKAEPTMKPNVKYMVGSNFVRKGQTGDWKNYFKPDLDARMDAWIQEKFQDTDLKFQFE